MATPSRLLSKPTRIDREGIGSKNEIDRILEFLKVFVDRCHHAKEEDFLFPALVRRTGPRTTLGRKTHEDHERNDRIKRTQSPWGKRQADLRQPERHGCAHHTDARAIAKKKNM